MSALINTNLQKSVRRTVAGLLVSEIEEINKVLAVYTNYPGGKPVINSSRIHAGKRPDIRNIRDFPAITVVSTGRNTEWAASRTTEDTVGLRVFCCVLSTDQPTTEDLIEDFTDSLVSVLYKYPKFSWSFTDTSGEIVTYATFDCKPTNVTHGIVDNGHLRAGQIDWQGKLFLAQDQSY